MKTEQAITILKEHNKWRRGTPPYDEVGNRQPYSAKDIGLAIDCVVEHFETVTNCNGLVWHKVADGDLPKDGSHIVYAQRTPYGYYYGIIYYPEPGITDDMNYWAEIPELPKED